ncbi:MAG: 2-phosphosulfolactate phosphatase [Bacillota bacterium]
MHLDVYPTAASAEGESFESRAAVVIDVLRATSVITAALDHGAVDVVPVATPEEALALAQDWPQDTYLLGGERQALPIPGFHVGNSPLEYTAERVGGRRVVLTTTNGTRALLAARGAASLFAASFLNARVVAREVAATGRDVAIICAGTVGRFDLADTVCAGLLVEALTGPAVASELNDLALAARELYGLHRGRLPELMYQCHHGQRLVALGLGDDLVYCAQEDTVAVVPRWSDGRLVPSTDPTAPRA